MNEVIDTPHKEHAHHELRVKNLHVHYGKVCALENVDLQFHCGQSVAVLGRNGTGKSSLLKAIAGLLQTATGTITWSGDDLKKHCHEVGYLPQREDVDWQFPITVRGLAEMGRFVHTGWFGKFGKADHASVDRALEVLGLQDLQQRQIAELSGGQQQRAFLARALAQEAHILLLDEPFSGLDLPSQEAFAEQLRELASTGHLVIASHHDLKTVADIFNHAVLLNRTVVADGLPSHVLTHIPSNSL